MQKAILRVALVLTLSAQTKQKKAQLGTLEVAPPRTELTGPEIVELITMLQEMDKIQKQAQTQQGKMQRRFHEMQVAHHAKDCKSFDQLYHWTGCPFTTPGTK